MNQPQISLQTFTIRKFLKNPADLERSLVRVKELGINALELARIGFTPGEIRQIDAVRQRENLRIASTQIKLDVIRKNPDWIAEMHHILDCSCCVVSVISLKHLKRGRAGLLEYADLLNRTGETMKKKGVNLQFHHHNFEFVPLDDSGGTGFEFLAGALDPSLVGLVLDTYWLQRSGQNPGAFIRRLGGRVTGVHLRDFRLTGPVWSPWIADAELGRGQLDFRDIVSACRETGVGYMAVEQASRKPWESLRISTDYLKKIGFAGLF